MRRLGLLILGAVAAVGLWLPSPVLSVAAPAPGLSEVQRKLDGAEHRLATRRGRERVLTTDVARYSQRVRMLQARVDVVASRQAIVQRDLDRRAAKLTRTQGALRTQLARRTRLRLRLSVVRRALARRMVELYEADRPDMVTVVLNSGGFADLLERMDFLGRIADSDKTIVRSVRVAHRDAISLAASLSKLERDQAALTRAVRARRDAIARGRVEAEQARNVVDRARQARRRVLETVRVSRAHVQREVSDLRAQQAKIQRALRAAQNANAGSLPTTIPAGAIKGAGGGPMIWPVDGPITSPFCERRSYEACHPGIDIGVPEGTPIRAAAAGKVVLMQSVAQSGGYGNYTCIQHTTSLSSCYAHQSRFGTTLGARVSQGQVIGYVGNTGHSFGAHLHWEVRVNGAITNPLNYV